MFALNQINNLNLLYLPPRLDGDYGPTALLAAELYCRKRGAMLVMDPPLQLETTEQLIAHYAQSGSASANVITYFPRVSIKGCLHPNFKAAGAAFAGLLCRLDKEQGPWVDLDGNAAELQRNIQPLVVLDEDEQQTLIRAGINVISASRGRRSRIHGAVTFGAGGHMYKAATHLAVHRTCLMILRNIERGTRWVVFEPNDQSTRERLRSQVHAYLSGLADSGALADDDVFVRCDPDSPDRNRSADAGVKILVSFMPLGWPQPLSFTIHQSIPGARTATTAFAPVRGGRTLRAS
jgi:phage tail sheath protein FI